MEGVRPGGGSAGDPIVWTGCGRSESRPRRRATPRPVKRGREGAHTPARERRPREGQAPPDPATGHSAVRGRGREETLLQAGNDRRSRLGDPGPRPRHRTAPPGSAREGARGPGPGPASSPGAPPSPRGSPRPGGAQRHRPAGNPCPGAASSAPPLAPAPRTRPAPPPHALPPRAPLIGPQLGQRVSAAAAAKRALEPAARAPPSQPRPRAPASRLRPDSRCGCGSGGRAPRRCSSGPRADPPAAPLPRSSQPPSPRAALRRQVPQEPEARWPEPGRRR